MRGSCRDRSHETVVQERDKWTRGYSVSAAALAHPWLGITHLKARSSYRGGRRLDLTRAGASSAPYDKVTERQWPKMQLLLKGLQQPVQGMPPLSASNPAPDTQSSAPENAGFSVVLLPLSHVPAPFSSFLSRVSGQALLPLLPVRIALGTELSGDHSSLHGIIEGHLTQTEVSQNLCPNVLRYLVLLDFI